MTDTVAKLGVTLTGDAKALDAALSRAQKDLEDFERRFGKFKPKFAPIEPPKIPREAMPDAQALSRAEAATLSFARARAALLRDSGDLAGAERILQGALDATTRSTSQTVGAQRQLLSVQKQLAGGGR